MAANGIVPGDYGDRCSFKVMISPNNDIVRKCERFFMKVQFAQFISKLFPLFFGKKLRVAGIEVCIQERYGYALLLLNVFVWSIVTSV
jgi:hypothetical protein